MDNRRLSPSQLTVLRRKVVEAVIEQGYKQSEVSRMLKISANSVSNYIRSYRQRGLESLTYKARGAPVSATSKISVSIENNLKETIEHHTPDTLDLPCVLWTRKAVQEYLKLTYKIEYSKSTIGRLLRKWGFSPQKPIKRAFEQDPIKVRYWLEQEYPKIKLKALKERVDIFWGDEMGLRSDDHRGRTYSKIGQTPVIRKTGVRFRCNMIAAINLHEMDGCA
jgi:transposase